MFRHTCFVSTSLISTLYFHDVISHIIFTKMCDCIRALTLSAFVIIYNVRGWERKREREREFRTQKTLLQERESVCVCVCEWVCECVRASAREWVGACTHAKERAHNPWLQIINCVDTRIRCTSLVVVMAWKIIDANSNDLSIVFSFGLNSAYYSRT